ncbi:septum formation family protein [uncultured Demequina sp.]|mgnify:CR=1 FL=1|uniref:septum formation family protein n=1 Tax=uncultured Demequina sp. TaxID=693499 RepID=UPI0025DF2458|nr:septum formation family protein [uncultured Demequina sp.]
MALAAWVAIAAGVALLIGISWSVALDATGRGLDPAAPETVGDLHAMQVVPGMCLESVGDDGAVGGTTVVECTAEHRAEVITSLVFEEARYPGDEEVALRSREHCGSRLDSLGPSGSAWVAWVPTAQSWQRGDKVALCVLVLDAPVTERIGPDRSTDADEAVEPGQEA